VYLFNPDEAFPIDFEVANWFTSTHPQSRFRQNVLVARAAGDRRLTLFNREFTVRQRDGRAEKRLLATPDEFVAVLGTEFGLSFPPGTRFDCPGLGWT
jgi:N-hydroxyarylamine O-acetyltransferase